MDKPFLDVILDFIRGSGFAAMTWQQGLMLMVSWFLIYLAIKKEYEPLLLLPIAFGMMLANLPLAGLTAEPQYEMVDGQMKLKQIGGLLYYLYEGVKLGIYPPLIFMGIGAMTDFGPLIANPKSLLGSGCPTWYIYSICFSQITDLIIWQRHPLA